MPKATDCLSILLVVSTISLMPACGNFGCPSLNDNVTWMSYGHFNFGSAGDDGTARNCVLHCGWSVFEGHNGGFGDTLQVASSSAAVVFAWAYNNFAGFRVTQGWTGETDRGAKLGDTLGKFQGLYPEFTVIDENQLEISNPKTGLFVDAYFDDKGLLTELNVGSYISR